MRWAIGVGFEKSPESPGRPSYTRSEMADQRFLYLLDKYRQNVPGVPWSLINTFPDEGLRDDLAVAHALRDEYGMSTPDGAVGGGVIGGWIAQALRARPNLLQDPAGLI